MFARANLKISEDLIEAFATAQDFSNNIRCLKVSIKDETMIKDQEMIRNSDSKSDFELMVGAMVVETEPCLLLYCYVDDCQQFLSWILIGFIPGSCKVREKMLYSSSRDDLKRTLGRNLIKSEYSANELSEFTWDSVISVVGDGRPDSSAMTPRELMIQQEKVPMIHLCC